MAYDADIVRFASGQIGGSLGGPFVGESGGGGVSNQAQAQAIRNLNQFRDVMGDLNVHLHAEQRVLPVPHMLPSRNIYYTDRADQLRRLHEVRRRAVTMGVPLVVVCVGPSGVGKSEFVTQWLWEICGEIPGPHLYADMQEGGLLSAQDVLGRFLRLMGEKLDGIQDTAELSGLFKSCLHDKPAIVFLDDVTLTAQVRPLLPNSPGSVTVITVQSLPETLPGAIPVKLEAMDGDAIWELVQCVAGAALPDGAEKDALVRAFGGSPLRAHAAGMQLALGRTLSDLTREVKRERDRLAVERPGDDLDVTAVLNTGYRKLSREAALLYRSLSSLFGRRFSAGLAAAAAGLNEGAELLDEVVAAGLADDLGDGRYRLHTLALDHARGLAVDQERVEARRRIVGWYLRMAVRADFSVLPKRWHLGTEYDAYEGEDPPLTDAEALAWFEEELGVLRGAVRAAAEQGWHGLVVQLVEAQWAMCLKRKPYDHWIAIHKYGIESAIELGDLRFLGRLRCQLGFAYLELGRLDAAAAEFAAAADADLEVGHVRGQATAVESLGLLNLARSGAEALPQLLTENESAAEEALSLLTENLSLNLTMVEEAEDHRAVALAWRHRGRALSATGAHNQAITHLLRARELFHALPDHYNEGKTYADLGQAYLRAARATEAAPTLQAALELLRANNSPADEARVLETISVLMERADEPDAAVDWLRPALEILEALHSPRAEAVGRRLAELTIRS